MRASAAILFTFIAVALVTSIWQTVGATDTALYWAEAIVVMAAAAYLAVWLLVGGRRALMATIYAASIELTAGTCLALTQIRTYPLSALTTLLATIGLSAPL